VSLFIQTNVASMVVQNSLAHTQNALSSNFTKLSSGYRINTSADDAAGLGISKSMNAQLRSLAVAQRNASDGISMAETADGAAEQIHSILTRMRELAVQGSNGTLNTGDSTNLDTEFQASLGEIDRIAQVTTFNGRNLLAGAVASVTFQVGINNVAAADRMNINFGGADVAGLAMTGAAVNTVANARTAIVTLDAAIGSLSALREGWGSATNRLTMTVSNLQSMQSNLSASLSRIRDVDVAAETSAMSKNQVLSQAGVAVLAQANQAPQLALSLLKG
jgi:flagellin